MHVCIFKRIQVRVLYHEFYRCINTCTYILLIFISTAKEKSRLHKKHVTGGGPPPPDYNEMDLAILRILGDSPAFKGVPVDDDDDLDSTIEVTKDPSVTDSMLKKCNALAVGRTSSVVKALNSGR